MRQLVNTALGGNDETASDVDDVDVPKFGRGYGAIPLRYGEGLESRLRAVAPDRIDAALDAVGTDEAVDVSLAVVEDRRRIVTIVASGRAQREGFEAVGGGNPASAGARLRARPALVEQAGAGEASEANTVASAALVVSNFFIESISSSSRPAALHRPLRSSEDDGRRMGAMRNFEKITDV